MADTMDAIVFYNLLVCFCCYLYWKVINYWFLLTAVKLQIWGFLIIFYFSRLLDLISVYLCNFNLLERERKPLRIKRKNHISHSLIFVAVFRRTRKILVFFRVTQGSSKKKFEKHQITLFRFEVKCLGASNQNGFLVFVSTYTWYLIERKLFQKWIYSKDDS